MNRKLLHWLPVVLWAALIFWLSAQSAPPDIGPSFPFKRKYEHAVGYAMLAFLTMRALCKGHALPLSKAAATGIVLVVAYAASDELHQSFVPNRDPRVTDVMIDSAGASIAIAAYYAYESHRSAKANRESA